MSYYCLRCEKQNNCKCEDSTHRFHMSDKVRAPTSTKNKVKFRKFLDVCPIFVNCVPDELRPDFLDLLRKIKYFNKVINGQEWTNIKK